MHYGLAALALVATILYTVLLYIVSYTDLQYREWMHLNYCGQVSYDLLHLAVQLENSSHCLTIVTIASIVLPCLVQEQRSPISCVTKTIFTTPELLLSQKCIWYFSIEFWVKSFSYMHTLLHICSQGSFIPSDMRWERERKQSKRREK